jgi:hypothetical protein
MQEAKGQSGISVKTGDMLIGIMTGYKTIPGLKPDGTPKESVLYTLTGTKDAQPHAVWGSNASMVAKLSPIKAGEVVLIVHRGQVVKDTKFQKAQKVNETFVATLDGNDIEKIAQIVQYADGVKVTNPNPVLIALGLPALK